LASAQATKESSDIAGKGGPAMQLRNARNVGHWIRRNLFDGWQVLGTIGLAVGAFGFALLLLKAGHALPSTGSTFQLLETLGSEVRQLDDCSDVARPLCHGMKNLQRREPGTVPRNAVATPKSPARKAHQGDGDFLLGLQRTAGNAAVASWLATLTPTVQAQTA